MKKILALVLIFSFIFADVAVAQSLVNPPRSTPRRAERNHYFPTWVPSNYNHVIIFCNGSWLPADNTRDFNITRGSDGNVLAFPSTWQLEWVHKSRDNSPPVWLTPSQVGQRTHTAGQTHPTRPELTLVLQRADGTWTPLAHPTTSLLTYGTTMFWANLAQTPAGQAPRQVLPHFFHEQNQPTQPLWSARFVNRSRTNNQTDGSLARELRNFYTENLSNITATYQGRNSQRRYPVNMAQSNAFTTAVSAAFRQDPLSQVKPFSPAFLDEVLRNVNFYFARRPDTNPWAGTYGAAADGRTSYIWVSTGRSSTNFVSSAIHEIGHALGLGETLATLNRELFLGWESNAISNYNLAYNTAFDRALMHRVGPVRFWEAAYYSNAAYAYLWDNNFGDIIEHWELELVRGVIVDSLRRPATLRNFNTASGAALNNASATIYADFATITNNSSTAAERAAARTRLRGWVEFYVGFANDNNIAPSRSVLDCSIANHHLRSGR